MLMIKDNKNKIDINLLLKILDKNSIEDITEEDIRKVENIVIKGYGEEKTKGIAPLEIIEMFPNLKAITVRGANLDTCDIEFISGFENIKSLSLLDCELECVDFEKLQKYPEVLKFIHCNNFPKHFPRLKNISISLSEIDLDSIDFTNVESIDIQSSTILNARDLQEYQSISYVNLNGSVLFGKDKIKMENIKVGSSAEYTHIEDERNLKVDNINIDKKKDNGEERE